MSKHNILYIIFPLIITHFSFSRQKKGGLLFEAESPRTSEPSTSATARAAEALVGRFTLHGKKPKCSELSNWLSHIVVRCLCPHSPHSLHSLPLPPLSFILSSNKESPYLFLLFLSLSPLYLIYIYIYMQILEQMQSSVWDANNSGEIMISSVQAPLIGSYIMSLSFTVYCSFQAM